MPGLVWAFAGRTYHIVGNLMSRLKCHTLMGYPRLCSQRSFFITFIIVFSSSISGTVSRYLGRAWRDCFLIRFHLEMGIQGKHGMFNKPNLETAKIKLRHIASLSKSPNFDDVLQYKCWWTKETLQYNFVTLDMWFTCWLIYMNILTAVSFWVIYRTFCMQRFFCPSV